MPDMSEPYAHLESEADRLKYEARRLRREAITLITRAEVMEVDEAYLRDAIERQRDADGQW